MYFKEGYVGIISKIKFYIPTDTAVANFIDLMHIQGSNDDVTYDTLFTPDLAMSAGWNYVEFSDPATRPKYRYYRFYGDANNAI